MNENQSIQNIMNAYSSITGLNCYFVQDAQEISSAKEKNFFCKCLKTSASALMSCESCTFENYEQALSSLKSQTYSCHAGLVKWSVPVIFKDVQGVIISEGVISSQQAKESQSWIQYLSETYNVSRSILLENYKSVRVMTEQEVDESIHLLEAIVAYEKAKQE